MFVFGCVRVRVNNRKYVAFVRSTRGAEPGRLRTGEPKRQNCYLPKSFNEDSCVLCVVQASVKQSVQTERGSLQFSAETEN